MAKRQKKTSSKAQAKVSTTSDVTIKSYRGQARWEIFIPIEPVPASRPRFSRTGRVYYGKRYTAFRKQAEWLFANTKFPRSFPLEGPLAISTQFLVTKPRTSKRASPVGDIDNYFKTLDVLNGVVWGDDDQLLWASMSKQFSEEPGIRMEILRIERLPETRKLSELWIKR